MKKISAIIFSLAILPAAISAETFFPRLSAVPVIDGRVSPGEYAGGFAGELKKMRRKVTADKTEVYFGCDDKNFYAAFICFDSDIKTLKKMFHTGEEHDNAIFLDDCVEVRFDPWNDPKLSAMRHIIVNANGISYDAVSKDLSRSRRNNPNMDEMERVNMVLEKYMFNDVQEIIIEDPKKLVLKPNNENEQKEN